MIFLFPLTFIYFEPDVIRKESDFVLLYRDELFTTGNLPNNLLLSQVVEVNRGIPAVTNSILFILDIVRYVVRGLIFN